MKTAEEIRQLALKMVEGSMWELSLDECIHKVYTNEMHEFANQSRWIAVEERDRQILEWINQNETELHEFIPLRQFLLQPLPDKPTELREEVKG